jgi:hypothetical protein
VRPVIALAGRRIDAPGAEPQRFPLERCDRVRAAIRDVFVSHNATALVSSAACGADLLALEVAKSLGLRRRVVLPFQPPRFRETSVVDRPGDWGPVFDALVEEVAVAGDVVIIGQPDGAVNAYAKTNIAILDEAEVLARAGQAADRMTPSERGDAGRVLAVIVWDGLPRGAQALTEDLTVHFAEAARRRGMEVVEVLTK